MTNVVNLVSNRGTVNIIADTKDVVFEGNKTSATITRDADTGEVTVSGGDSVDFRNTFNGKLNLYAKSGKVISFDGAFADPGGNGTVNVGGTYDSSNYDGTVIFNNTVTQNKLSIYNGATVKIGNNGATFGTLNLKNLANDANGGLIDSTNSHIDSLTLGNVQLGSTLNINVDIDSANTKADTFKITNGNNRTINISGLKFIDSDLSTLVGQGEKTVLVLDDSQDKMALTIDPSITSSGILETIEDEYFDVHPVANWDEKFDNVTTEQYIKGDISAFNSVRTKTDSIKYKVNEVTDPEEVSRVQSDRDTLAVLNQYVTTEERKFSATAETPNYSATEDLGQTASGTFTITGVEGSVLDLGTHTGFEITNADTTLNLNSLELKGTSPAISVSDTSAIINLNDTKISSDITGSVNYALNTSGDNTIAAGITNANITNNGALSVTKDNAFTTSNYTNAAGGSLNFQTQNIETQNFGTLTLSDNMNFTIDVDLLNTNTDRITATTVNANGHNIIIDAIYLMTDGATDTTYVTLTNNSQFTNVYKLSDTILSNITKAPTVANSYSVSYSDFGSVSGLDADKGILVFKSTNDTLAKTVVKEEDVKEYIIPSYNEEVEQDLTTLYGQSLTITGNNKEVHGNNFGGVTLGNGENNQSLYVNDVADFSGFSTAAIINKSKGTVNISNSVFKSNTNADIDNSGILNLNNTNSFEKIIDTDNNGTMNVLTGVSTVSNTLTQYKIEISDGAKLINNGTASIGTLNINSGATLTNNSNATVNTTGENNSVLSGNGIFNVAGTFTNNGTFSQDTLSIKNGGKFVSSGSDSFVVANITNDENGGYFDSLNNNLDRYTVGKANLSSALNMAIDMTLASDLTSDSDTFTLNSTDAGSGTFNISSLNLTGEGIDKFRQSITNKEIVQKVLNNANENTVLKIDSAVKSMYDVTIADEIITGTEDFSGTTIKYNADFGGYEFTRSRVTEMSVTGSDTGLQDSIKWAITVTDGDRRFTSKKDNLNLINVAEGASRTFDFDGTTNTYTSTENAGTTATGKLTILGTKSGDNYSTIDADGNSLFDMSVAGTTVELQNTKVINADYVANVAEGNELILDNSIIDASNTSGIANNGKLTLKNNNEINKAITGTGNTTVSTGKTILNALLNQNKVNISSGAKLETVADNLTASSGIENKGDLYFTGGTTQSAISGAGGVTHIQGAVTLAQAITDNIVSLDKTATGSEGVALMGINSLSGLTANGGDLNLQYQEGTENYSLDNLSLADDMGVKINLDLTGNSAIKKADNISANNVTGDGTIYLNNIKITVPNTGDAAPTYAKVSDNLLKDKIELAKDTRVKVDSLSQDGFLITYAKDKEGANTGGYLNFTYTDLVSAVRDNSQTRVYVMGQDENIGPQLTEHGGSGITDDTHLFGGSALSVNGSGKSIIGSGTTGGIELAGTQTLSLNDILEYKGFSTGITNYGTVNITDVTFKDNTVDIDNNGILNLYGTDVFNTITDKEDSFKGTTTITSYTDENGNKISSDVTVNNSLKQDSVVITGAADENNKLTLAEGSTFEASITNAGTVDNKGTMTINGGSNTKDILSSNDAGKIEFKGNFDNSGTINQSNVTVTSGILTNAATTGSITAEIENASTIDNMGTITTNGGSNSSTISGTGSFTIADNFENNGSFTQNDLIVNSGKSFTNTKTAIINNSVSNSGTIANNAANAVINFKGADMTIGGTVNNIADAIINIDGTGTTTLSATTENNGILNTKSNTNISSAITGTGSVINTASTLNVQAGVSQVAFTNTSGEVIVDNSNGSISTTGIISNAGTITSNADNLKATGGISNTSILNLIGGETQSNITGSNGTTYIKGDVTLSKTIEDNIISVENNGIANLMTSANIEDALKFVANGGDLNLQKESTRDSFNLGNVDIQKNMGLAIDVNLSPNGQTSKEADNISANSVVDGSAKILINNINILADSNDVIPSYAKVASDNLKNRVNIGDASRIQIDSTSVQGVIDNFMITYVTDESESDATLSAGGYLKFEYSDLVNAVKSLTENKTYIMSKDENVTSDLTPLNGSSLSISGNNNKIIGQGTTVGISPVKDGQTLSIFDVKEISGFDTAIQNTAGTVNLENVTMTGNTTDVDNNGTLNLNGTDVLDTVTGTGSTTIGNGEGKNGNVTINKKLEQDSLTVSSESDKLTNKGASTIKDVVNNGTIENEKTLNITNSLDNANGTIANTVENAVLNLTGEDMTVAGTIKNAANAEVNIDGTGTTTLSATTENNGNLNTKSDTTITGNVSGTGSTTNTADNLSIQAAIEQATFTNTEGVVTVDDEKGSITTTNNIVNDGTLTANADNLKAGNELQNNNTLNLTGGENTNKITGDNGSVNFSNEVTNSGTINQKEVTNNGDLTNNALIQTLQDIVNLGILTSNGDNIKAGGEVKNSDTLNITGGTNTNKVTGDGTTNTSGTVVNEGSITQSALNNTGDLDNKSAIIAAVTNDGTLKNNGNIEGDVTNNGNADNKGEIKGSVENNEGADFENNGTITDKVDNSGKFTNNDTINGNVKNTETGDFDNNSTISTNLDNSGNFDNVDGVVSGTVDNKPTGTITTKIQGLTSDSINNDGTIKYVDSGSTIKDITGSGRVELRPEDDGTVKLNNTLDNNTLALYNGTLIFDKVKDVAGFEADGGTINAINGKNQTVNLGKVTINDKTNVKLDFNLGSQGTDKFKSSSITNNGGSFNVSAVKVSGMTMKDHIRVHLGDTTTLGRDNVTSDSFKLPTVLTPIRYIKGSVSGGYLTYEPTGNSYRDFNPSIMASSVTALVAGYQNQMQSLHDGFFHMERYMKYAKEDRVAAEQSNKYAALEPVVGFDEYSTPEVSQAMWTKPYTTFERVNLKGGVKVDNIAYGTMYGGDTDMFQMKNGFKGVISGFVGYNGNQMSYDGISMTQNGGYLGATLSAYKGNFFTGVTVSTGASTGDADTRYGKDEITLLTAGIANKTGYNFEFKEGKIILQPSVFLGYSWVNTLNYTNAAGARITQDALNALQIAPGIKLIGNTKNGWQPYASADVVWNIFMGRGEVKANDIVLPNLAEKTYVQYGVGIQKSWKDRFTAFGETMVRNGGRNGVVLQGGFRWTVGKDYSNVPTKKKYIQPKDNTNLKSQAGKTTMTKGKNKFNLLTKFDDNYKYTLVISQKMA
ncbi:hypothetical protein IJ182_01545 [bacterium]|nr:hypothetical protein [bacterium]